MNRYKKVIQVAATALCILLLSGLSSCKKDLLDPKPKNQIDQRNAFDTPARIEAQVNGIYDAVKAGQHLGGRYLIYTDIRGEEFINRTANSVTGQQTWNHSLTSSANEVEGFWGAAYTAINNINVFLKGLEEHGSKVDAKLVSQFKAEAKFLRALTYFDLLVLYAMPYTSNSGTSPGLPLRLQAETSSANNDLPRSTVAAVYQQILADLNEAEANLPSTYSSATLRVTRAHKHAAIALKTRVYLSMGQYNNVITEASKIVTGTAPNFVAPSATGIAHKLEANVTTPFSTYTTTESIFSMPMTDSDPPGTQNQLGYYYNRPGVGGGEYFLNTSTVTATAGIWADTSWKSTDARRVNFLTVSGGNTYLTKFNKPSPYTDYVPVLRYAEILLNYAEAAAETGDLAKAADLIKAVRNRSDASYTFGTTVLNDKQKLINAIWVERRIELLGEGFRSIDLLRRNLPIPAKSTVNQINPTHAAYIWPIPNSEILSNKKL